MAASTATTVAVATDAAAVAAITIAAAAVAAVPIVVAVAEAAVAVVLPAGSGKTAELQPFTVGRTGDRAVTFPRVEGQAQGVGSRIVASIRAITNNARSNRRGPLDITFSKEVILLLLLL